MDNLKYYLVAAAAYIIYFIFVESVEEIDPALGSFFQSNIVIYTILFSLLCIAFGVLFLMMNWRKFFKK